MQVIIIGCGRVGTALARHLVENGADVVVIEKDRDKLDKISDLNCLSINGMIIDRDAMKASGMDNADVCCCVSDNENLNLMAGQIAREFFHVPLIICRVYNSSHIDVFEEEGFRIISSTENTLHQLLSCFEEPQAENGVEIEGQVLGFTRLELEESWVGCSILDVEREIEEHILGVLHQGEVLLARSDLIIEEGDELILVYREEEE